MTKIQNRDPISDSVSWLLDRGTFNTVIPILDLLVDIVLIGDAAYTAIVRVKPPSAFLRVFFALGPSVCPEDLSPRPRRAQVEISRRDDIVRVASV
jgi:hypothetical protein